MSVDAVQLSEKSLDRDCQTTQFFTSADYWQRSENAAGAFSIKNGRELAKQSRAYTLEQVGAICKRQSDRTTNSKRFAYATRLRTRELKTLFRPEEKAQSGNTIGCQIVV